VSETSTYLVRGMTCGHCVSAVTSGLTELAGVTEVDVDLNSEGDSSVTVHSTEALDPRTVRSAVREAGYTLVR
jgi:copper chaperone